MSSVRDLIIIAVLLFVVGITAVFTVMIGHRVNENLLNMTVINDSAEAKAVIESADTAINMTDYAYLALFVGLFFAMIVFGWIVGGMPIMAPIYFFLVVIFTFVSVILQNVWIDLAADSSILATTLDLPITTFILNHLGYFMAIFGLIGIIAMFAKPQNTY